MKKAIYVFSGDPITYGHIDIIKRAASTFDEIIVGIGSNPDKTYMFSLEERTLMAERAIDGISNVRVKSFNGLLVDFAYEQDVSVIVKGVRNSQDFAYENFLHQLGESQKLGIDTFILFARPELAHISSSAVKALQKDNGFIQGYVPLHVKQALEAKMAKQYIIGVTGEIGTGKSYLSKSFTECGLKLGIETHHIDLDAIGHQILEELTEPKYLKIREQLIDCFGKEVGDPSGMINRKKLGQVVFNDAAALSKLNSIMGKPILVRLKRELYGKSGLIILNAALLVETGTEQLCNNNVVLMQCSKSTQEQRLLSRGLTKPQIRRRLDSQYSFLEKKKIIENAITSNNHGRLWITNNNGRLNEKLITETLKSVMEELGMN